MKKLTSLFFIFTLVAGAVLGQGGSMNTWYMGRNAGMRFIGNNKPVAIYNSAMQAYGGVVSVSSESGQLLFYSDGKNTYNSNHVLMDNGTACTLPTPYKSRVIYAPIRGTSRYLVFASGSKPQYFEIDMSLNGGLGKVTRKQQLLDSTLAKDITSFTLVNSCRDEGYWLVGAVTPSREARAYRINENGVSGPVVSDLGIPIYQAGDFAASIDGSRMAISHFTDINPFILYCSFDKVCGKIAPLIELHTSGTEDYHPFGLEFSKSGQFLYAAYSVAESQLYQFDLFSADPNLNPYLISSNTSNFNQLQMGPDGKIYISTHTGGGPGNRIDVIHNPEAKGVNCNYEYNYLDLGRATQFELPWFFPDREQNCITFRKPVVKTSNTCLGSKTQLELNPEFSPDSFYWDLGVAGAPQPRTHAVEFIFPASGTYKVQMIWYLCGLSDTIKKIVTIGPKPVIKLGPDTTICAGSGFWMDAGAFQHASFLWSTGDTSRQIFVSDAKSYTVTVSYGDCSSSATRNVRHWPSVWSTLGKEFFLCEEEDQLVKLDAGKGFTHYKWTPTGDSTQWIIVERTGPYFVMVTDWRGCSTESGTQVRRKCPVYLYVPNSFTPNGDGLNDRFGPVVTDATEFSVEIYNTWGTLLFSSKDPAVMWDGTFMGKACESGVYCWKLNYQGYVKSELRNFNTSGTIHLLR